MAYSLSSRKAIPKSWTVPGSYMGEIQWARLQHGRVSVRSTVMQESVWSWLRRDVWCIGMHYHIGLSKVIHLSLEKMGILTVYSLSGRRSLLPFYMRIRFCSGEMHGEYVKLAREYTAWVKNGGVAMRLFISEYRYGWELKWIVLTCSIVKANGRRGGYCFSTRVRLSEIWSRRLPHAWRRIGAARSKFSARMEWKFKESIMVLLARYGVLVETGQRQWRKRCVKGHLGLVESFILKDVPLLRWRF